MTNENYLLNSFDTVFPLDKSYKKNYNGINTVQKNVFDDTFANSALDYLYSNENLGKTQNFLESNGFLSIEERQYNKEAYGAADENRQMLDLFQSKSNSVLNPAISNDTDRAFLSGLMGDEEEKVYHQNQIADANSAIKQWQSAFSGSPLESQLNGVADSALQKINTLPTTKPDFFNAKSIDTFDFGQEYDGNNEPNAPLALTQLSDVSKTGNNILSKNYTNHVYTSWDNSYTEKSKGNNGFFNKDYYYVEKDGKRYRANSLETATLTDWNSIDTNFLDEKFVSIINKANEKPTTLKRILTQSIKGELNFKTQLDGKKLYLINGVLYNKNEAGNFTWAYFLESKNVSGLLSGLLAQGGSLFSPLAKMDGVSRLDEEWDRRARWAGVKYYYEKNNILWLYYLRYGTKLKY